MKVLAVNGSARKNGNTAILINTLLAELEAEGIGTEQVQLAGKDLHGCLACYTCFETKDRRCIQKKDLVNELIEKMLDADGIVLGSPTYFANVTTNMKSLIDRAGMTSIANGRMFARKVGAAVVAARRGGAIHTFDSLNHFFFINEMIVPGSIYWNMGFGREIGEVNSDEEGLRTMSALGKHMAWLLKKIHA
ncbi:flavodoxin family protein [Desulfolutivibrio sulfoxidireducens]|uniref:flavodoxin family protein n=1 Tax=Desulfolutivibrio sulfoxidireducens TaxID=2773299 RepID=UPI00159D76BC|nr:flavodoxin family protein [Desulfolutivibrio sulfoxidireducens]QLA17448.1 flavodoxin family protein [Desulfolutivibrio sulfoxidireducens]QLA21037.1 flavodoxin family protein [Desulfolutivibrio sulfoxidireducens]